MAKEAEFNSEGILFHYKDIYFIAPQAQQLNAIFAALYLHAIVLSHTEPSNC